MSERATQRMRLTCVKCQERFPENVLRDSRSRDASTPARWSLGLSDRLSSTFSCYFVQTDSLLQRGIDFPFAHIFEFKSVPLGFCRKGEVIPRFVVEQFPIK